MGRTAPETEGERGSPAGGIAHGNGEEGEPLGALKRQGSSVGARRGPPPREKGPTVVATRAEMAVKKGWLRRYGDSESKCRLEWAFNSIERRLRQAFYLTDRTPHSVGA